MTEQTRPATEPRTEAGRDVLSHTGWDELLRSEKAEYIRDIEDEARQQGVNEVEAILRRHLMAAVMPEKERNDD